MPYIQCYVQEKEVSYTVLLCKHIHESVTVLTILYENLPFPCTFMQSCEAWESKSELVNHFWNGFAIHGHVFPLGICSKFVKTSLGDYSLQCECT